MEAPLISRFHRAALAVVLLLSLSAGAARADRCLGAKVKAIGKKEKALLACQAKVALGASVEPACDTKAMTKFGSAYARFTCTAPAASVCEDIADDCRDRVRAALSDGSAATPSRCEAARLKAAGKKAGAKLGCYAKAAAKDAPVDSACLLKAEGKFSTAYNKVSGCPTDGPGGEANTESLIDDECVAQLLTVDGTGRVLAICPGGATTTTSTTAAPTSTTGAPTTTTASTSTTTSSTTASSTTNTMAPTTTTTTSPPSTTTTTLAFTCGAPPPADPPLLPDDDPFYEVPASIPEPPGTVLRWRAVNLAALSSSSPTPFSAWQVLYASTDVNDQPSATVATVILPCTPAATTPRPLLSYQTAEDSLALMCAPSYEMRLGTEKEEVSLPPLLAQGWVVVTSDYEGPQSQLAAGIQAGHGVLDGIRAAENFAASHPDLGLNLAGVDTPVGLWGYSGGALASSWASELAPTYAPELHIVGVAEGGVPPDLTAAFHQIDGGLFSSLEALGAVGLGRAYPELLTLMSDDGRAKADVLGSECVEQAILQYPCERLDSYTIVTNAIELPWVQEILSFNHLGNVCTTYPFQTCMEDSECNNPTSCLRNFCTTSPSQSCTMDSDCSHVAGTCRKKHPTAPLYIYHGINDEILPVNPVNALVEQYCNEGVTVEYYQDPASDHNSLAFSGAPAAIAYLTARFAGTPAPSTCGTPSVAGVVPPVQCSGQ
jgi:hypothetical protein